MVAVIAMGFAIPSHLDASTAWHSISTVHFTVKYRTGMEDLGVLTADLSEEVYNRVSNIFYHDLTRVVSVDVWPAHQGPEFTGPDYTNFDSRNGLLLKNNYRIVLTYPGSIPAFRRSLAHEITRSFQYDIFADERVPVPGIRAMNMPGWFTEAIALYVSGMTAGGSTMPGLGIRPFGGPGLYSMSGFTGYSMFGSIHEGPGFIGFLDTTFGRTTIGEIIRDVRDTGDFNEALRIATGKDYQVLGEDLSVYYERNNITERTERDTGDAPVIIAGGQGSDRAFNILPTISPDGKRIAYLAAGNRSPVLRIASIRMPRVGETDRMTVDSITDLPTGRVSLCPVDNRITWAGDGRTVLLAGRLNGSEALLFIDAGTGRIRSSLRMPFSAVMCPSLSRDDEYIVFTGAASVSADIYIYSRTAGSITRLTDDAFMDRDPVMTSDSSGVIFATNRNEGGEVIRDSYDIIRQDIKTGFREVLVSNGFANLQPAISPDGKQILYISNEKGLFDMYSLDLKSRRTKKLTDSRSGMIYPSWFPTGNRIVYTRNSARGSDIIVRDMVYSASVK
jgi:Tol biopolymer transport system component